MHVNHACTMRSELMIGHDNRSGAWPEWQAASGGRVIIASEAIQTRERTHDWERQELLPIASLRNRHRTSPSSLSQ